MSDDAAGDDDHGSRLIRQYDHKGITGTAAGLAYNLGVGHAQITDQGLHRANPNPAGGALVDYDFKSTANFNDAVNNLTRFVHYTLIAHDPQTNAD